MKRRFSKLVALVVAIMILTVAFAGCGGSSTTTSTAGSTTASQATTAETTQKPEPVVLKVGSPVLEGVAGFQDDPVITEVQNRLNVKIDWINFDDKYAEKINAMVAANDLPDIMYTQSIEGGVDKLVKGNQIIQLDELVEKYGKNLTTDTELKARLWYARNFEGPNDGRLFYILTQDFTSDIFYRPSVSNYMRWDIYKQAGKPELKTSDDLLNVLAAMQKTNPETKDGKKVYGLGGWFADGAGWGDWPFATIQYAKGLYGAGQGNYITAFDISTSDFTSDAECTNPDSEYWKTIKWFNKAKQMGLLDPDSFTQKYDQYQAKLKEGRYLLTYPNWDADGANAAFAEAGMVDAGFVLVPPLDNTDSMILSFPTPFGSRPHVITKACKNPEKAMEFLDFCASDEGSRLMENGIQGVHWDMVDGKPQIKEEVIAKKPDQDYCKKEGMNKYWGIIGTTGMTMLSDGQYADLAQTSAVISKKMKPFDKEAMEFFKFPDPDFKNPQLKYYSYKVGSVQAVVRTMPDDVTKIFADVSNYMFKEQFKAILAKTDAEFDTIKADIIEGVKAYKPEVAFKWRKETLAAKGGEMLKVLNDMK